MTTPRDPDAIMSAWLEEGPTRLPDQTRRAIVVAIPTTTQRRRGWLAPWRSSPMNPIARIAIAAIAVVAVVGGAAYVLRPNGQVGGPPLTPTASPATSTPPSVSRLSDVLQIDLGSVPANVRATTSTFTPAFTFVAGPGWSLDGKGPSHAWLSDPKGGFMIVRPAEMIAVGGSKEAVPADIVAWLRARSDFDLAASTPISIGGIEGTLLRGSVRPGVKKNAGHGINIACSADVPCDFENGNEFGFGDTDQFEIAIVKVRGETLMLGISAPTADWDAEGPALEAILQSITFPPAGG